ncbi:hypothetical protein STBA_46350 [Streptomyces sp. MP131-18]|nr:hypothetical protein STBA_46350 [Streptomyces sp. MP131-18]
MAVRMRSTSAAEAAIFAFSILDSLDGDMMALRATALASLPDARRRARNAAPNCASFTRRARPTMQ